MVFLDRASLAQNEIDDALHRLDELERDFQKKLQETQSRQEQILNQPNDARNDDVFWPIVILGLVVFGGFVGHLIYSKLRKRRTQKVSLQARDIVYMIWEDVTLDDICDRIDTLELTSNDSEHFLLAMKMSTIGLPIFWYRPDIPQMLEAVDTYVRTGRRQSLGTAASEDRSQTDSKARKEESPAPEAIEFQATANPASSMLKIECNCGHRFEVPKLFAGTKRKCPACGASHAV